MGDRGGLGGGLGGGRQRRSAGSARSPVSRAGPAPRPTIPGGPLVGDRDRGTSSHPRRRRDGPRSGRRGLPRRATRGSAGGRPAHRRRTPGPAPGIGADSSAGRRGTAPAGDRRARPQELEGLPADPVGGVRSAGLHRPAGVRVRGARVAPPLGPRPHPSRAMDRMAPGRCAGSRRPGHTIGRGPPADRGLDGGDRPVRGPGVGRGHPAQQGGPDQGLGRTSARFWTDCRRPNVHLQWPTRPPCLIHPCSQGSLQPSRPRGRRRSATPSCRPRAPPGGSNTPEPTSTSSFARPRSACPRPGR